MTQQPKVSVVVPVYNGADYLEQCLDSILGQTLKEIEIICVDDGSTDRSAEILKRYAAGEERIVLLSQQNRGSGAARNYALSVAKGAYVAFMDSDDLYPAEDTLERMYQAVQQSGSKVAAGYRCILDQDGCHPDENDPLYALAGKKPDGAVLKYEEVQYDFNYQAYLFQRAMLEENQITFPDYLRFQDPPFFVRAMIAAERFYLLPCAAYVYRLGHQDIRWTARRCNDLALGHIDNLNLSREHGLAKLHRITANRLEYRNAPILAQGLTMDNLKLYALVVYANTLVDFDLIDQAADWRRPDRILRTVSIMENRAADLIEQNEEEGTEYIVSFLEEIRRAFLQLAPDRQGEIDSSLLGILASLFSGRHSAHMREKLRCLIHSDAFARMKLTGHEEEYYTPSGRKAMETLNSIDTAFQFAAQLNRRSEDKHCTCIHRARETTPAKVTVIIPVYNVEKYLAECLDSVLNQTLKEVEIICMDDGSPDNSLAVLKDYAARYPNITILKQDNAGLSASRNRCVEAATGTYIHFLDSDDTIKPDAYERLYEKASREALDMLFFDGESFYESKELEEKYVWYKKGYQSKGLYDEPMSGQDYYCKTIFGRSFRLSPCMYVIRREFVQEHGLTFPEGILHEDNLFTNVSTLEASRVGRMNVPFYNRRVREGSLTINTLKFKHSYGYFECYLRFYEYLCGKSLSAQVQEAAFIALRAILKHAREDYTQLDADEKNGWLALPPKESAMYDLLVKDYCESEALEKLEKKCDELDIKYHAVCDEKRERGIALRRLTKRYETLDGKYHTVCDEKRERGIALRRLTRQYETLNREYQDTKEKNRAQSARIKELKAGRKKAEQELKAGRKKAEQELKQQKKANKKLKKSASYRIGRVITFPARKLKALVRKLTGRGKKG